MKEKGFTLVELLAVLVILAILVAISVPIVTNIIDSSKLGAAQSSATGLISAAEVLYGNRMLEDPYYDGEIITFVDGEFGTDFTGSTQTFEYTGKLPASGTITIGSDESITLTDIYFDSNDAYCSGTKGNITCSEAS